MRAFGTKTAVFTAAALLLGTSAYAANEKSGKLDKKLHAATQKLHASNQAEVEAGQLAARTAQSPEVKQYAQRLVDDHQRNDEELKGLAKTLNVNLEGEEFTKQQKKAQKDLEKVQGKSGAEFDKAYMKMMVAEHERDVKDVEKAAKDARKGNHTELATFLDTTHSHLNMHLEEARRIERTAGSGVASGSGSTTSGTAPSSTQSDATGTDRAATTGGTKGAETGTSSPEGGAGTGGSTTGRIGSTDTTTGGTGSGAAGTTTEGDRAATTGGTSGAETGTTGGSGRTSSTTGTGTDTSTSGSGAAGSTPEGDRAATTGGTSGAETGTSSPQGAGTGGSTTSGSGTTR